MLRLEPPLWEEATARIGDAPARAALEATARLFRSLFPTVTGPCDTTDFNAEASSKGSGPVAIYLYDIVPYGVGLTIGAYDRMNDLVDRAAERVRDCPCSDDEGCFRCIRNPHAEQQASKAATESLLDLIARELRIEPVVTRSDAAPSPVATACPTCQTPHTHAAIFCSNCGTRLEAAS